MDIYSDQKYCVYITHYSGDKMPQNYIGSSTVEKVNNGYHGSIRSKKYRTIWESELKEHPELFNTTIISYHYTGRDSLWKELQLQRMFNVVKNNLFVNMSYATVNGFFGAAGTPWNKGTKGLQIPWNKGLTGIQSGDKNPFYGKSHLDKSKKTIGDKNAKFIYQVFSPDGKTFITHNLKRFCVEYGLTSAGMFATARGAYPTHKGWYCKKLSPKTSNLC